MLLWMLLADVDAAAARFLRVACRCGRCSCSRRSLDADAAAAPSRRRKMIVTYHSAGKIASNISVCPPSARFENFLVVSKRLSACPIRLLRFIFDTNRPQQQRCASPQVP